MKYHSITVLERCLACVAMFVLSLFSSLLCAEELVSTESASSQITHKYSQSIVSIESLGASKDVTSLGMGFLVTDTGVIITSYSAITGIFPVQIRLTNGDTYDNIAIIENDARKDIAIVKIKGFGLPFIPLGDSNTVTLGDKLIMIGNLKKLEYTAIDGSITTIRDTGNGYKLFDINTPISTGTNGCPVFNIKGEVIGITCPTPKDGQPQNSVVPINYARGMVSDKEKMNLKEFTNSLKSEKTGQQTEIKTISDEEWGKQIITAITTRYKCYDYYWSSIYGRSLIRNPFEGGYTSIFSPDIYIARDKLNSTSMDISNLQISDQELAGVSKEYSQALKAMAEVVVLRIDSLKSTSLAEIATIMGEVNTKEDAAETALQSVEVKLIQILKKRCPAQISLFPAFLIENADLPQATVDFSFYVSTDEPRILIIYNDSEAKKAGFKSGDLLLGVEKGIRFTTKDEWWKFLSTQKVGDKIKLEVLRGDKRKTMKVKLTSRT